MNNTIKDGMVCIDLGANIGYATMLMIRNVGEAGYVYAIEPGLGVMDETLPLFIILPP